MGDICGIPYSATGQWAATTLQRERPVSDEECLPPLTRFALEQIEGLTLAYDKIITTVGPHRYGCCALRQHLSTRLASVGNLWRTAPVSRQFPAPPHVLMPPHAERQVLSDVATQVSACTRQLGNRHFDRYTRAQRSLNYVNAFPPVLCWIPATAGDAPAPEQVRYTLTGSVVLRYTLTPQDVLALMRAEERDAGAERRRVLSRCPLLLAVQPTPECAASGQVAVVKPGSGKRTIGESETTHACLVALHDVRKLVPPSVASAQDGATANEGWAPPQPNNVWEMIYSPFEAAIEPPPTPLTPDHTANDGATPTPMTMPEAVGNLCVALDVFAAVPTSHEGALEMRAAVGTWGDTNVGLHKRLSIFAIGGTTPAAENLIAQKYKQLQNSASTKSRRSLFKRLARPAKPKPSSERASEFTLTDEVTDATVAPLKGRKRPRRSPRGAAADSKKTRGEADTAAETRQSDRIRDKSKSAIPITCLVHLGTLAVTSEVTQEFCRGFHQRAVGAMLPPTTWPLEVGVPGRPTITVQETDSLDTLASALTRLTQIASR